MNDRDRDAARPQPCRDDRTAMQAFVESEAAGALRLAFARFAARRAAAQAAATPDDAVSSRSCK